MLPFTHHNPVVALGARDWRRQPNLLVRRLLVNDIGANWGKSECEDASLGDIVSFDIHKIGTLEVTKQEKTNAIFYIHILSVLLKLLELRDDALEIDI